MDAFPSMCRITMVKQKKQPLIRSTLLEGLWVLREQGLKLKSKSENKEDIKITIRDD